MKDKKRYGEAFKLKVMEELQDGKWKTVADAAQAYGVSAQVKCEYRRKDIEVYRNPISISVG